MLFVDDAPKNDAVDINLSIHKNRIVFKNVYNNIIEPLFFYIIGGFFIFSTAVLIQKVLSSFANSGDRNFVLIILLAFILFVLYVLYKKATERKLLRIETGVSKSESFKIITDYIEHSDWYITEKDDIHIRARDKDTLMNGTSLIFIFFDGYLLFNIMSNTGRHGVKFVTLLGYKWLIKEIQAHFKRPSGFKS